MERFDVLCFDDNQFDEKLQLGIDFISFSYEAGHIEENPFQLILGNLDNFEKIYESTDSTDFGLDPSVLSAKTAYRQVQNNSVHDKVNTTNVNQPTTFSSDAVEHRRQHHVAIKRKDSAYLEKRSKKNKSAKRSRDLKREKHKLLECKVEALENEKLELMVEVRFLRQRNTLLNKQLMAMSTGEDYMNSLFE